VTSFEVNYSYCMRIIFSIIPCILFAKLAWANCELPNSRRAPQCPTSGTTLLNDTYPAAAHVISVSPFRASPESAKVPTQFVLKVMESYNYRNSPPIIIPASEADFNILKASIEEEIARSRGRIPRSVLNNIVHAPAMSYTWQQDYFEAFFDPTTGRPVLRNVDGYSNLEGFPPYTARRALESFSSIANSCNINSGPPLLRNGSPPNAAMGGNIEGLPGGLCMFGDNQTPEYAAQYCGSPDNFVQLDVGWLEVGHVDEVFKVIPSNRSGVPQECNFTIMIASPRKAKELLAAPHAANHNLFSILGAGASQEEIEAFRRSREIRPVGNKICELYRERILPSRNTPSNQEQNNGGGARRSSIDFKPFFSLLMSSAHAGLKPAGNAPVPPACMPDTITNLEFLNALEEPNVKAYNDLVQASLDESRDKILAKIFERLPQCRGHVQVMEVPNLFYGRLEEDESGVRSLPKNGNGGSFFPNPTNSVVANQKVIFSDPQNQLFRNYLNDQLRSNRMQADYIDTWDYSHLGNGNLHCSSHTIPYCAPVRR
jgi:hypothetical protein